MYIYIYIYIYVHFGFPNISFFICQFQLLAISGDVGTHVNTNMDVELGTWR